MSRLTITLSEERHRALKEAAARRDTSMSRIIEESLEFYGVKAKEERVDSRRGRPGTVRAGRRRRDGCRGRRDKVRALQGGPRSALLSGSSMDFSWEDWTVDLPSRGPRPM